MAVNMDLSNLDLIFTHHAEMRMQERHIDKELVKSAFTNESIIWHNIQDGKHKLILKLTNKKLLILVGIIENKNFRVLTIIKTSKNIQKLIKVKP